MRSKVFKDFCPLCASTFQGETAAEVARKILEHIDSGYCGEHRVPMEKALWIDSYEKAKALDKDT